jgi:hypothetical protein
MRPPKRLGEKRGADWTPDYDRIAHDHVEDVLLSRLPPEDVASNIAEDMRRAWKSGRSAK